MTENEWLDMSEEEAIAATIQCINLNGDDTLPCMRCPGDGMGDGYCQAAWNITVNALKDISKYRNMEKRLAEHYGECDRLLDVVVDGLCKHTDIDIGTPIKSRLLTDEDVDRWEAYKSIGTVEECREAMEKSKSLDVYVKQVLWERDIAIQQLEEIGVSLGEKMDDVKEAVEKQKAQKPRDIEYDYSYFICPTCGEGIYVSDNFESHKYCLNCGQAIDWEESEEE